MYGRISENAWGNIIRCQKCGQINPWDAVSCSACGARFNLSAVKARDYLGWGILLFVIVTISAFVVGSICLIIGESIYVPGGGLDQPAYTWYYMGYPFLIFAVASLAIWTPIAHKRVSRLTALREITGSVIEPTTGTSSAPPPLPAGATGSIEERVQQRTRKEFEGYVKIWWAFVVMNPALFFIAMLVALGYAMKHTSDPAPFITIIIISYCYMVISLVLFTRYPSKGNVRARLSRWRSEPTALAPLYTEGRDMGPASIASPLLIGIMALWVPGLLAFVFSMASPILGEPATIVLYCFPLAAGSLGGMVIHRRHANQLMTMILGDK